MKINPKIRARALRDIRQRIAAAKALPSNTERQVERFIVALSRVGATVLLYEGDLFGSYTPPRRKRKGKR